jgi:hypothetical protein
VQTKHGEPLTVQLYETVAGHEPQLLTDLEQDVDCTLVLWRAEYMLGEGSTLLVEDGHGLLAMGEEAMRPDRTMTSIIGQLRTNITNASAQFWDAQVRAPIGSDVQLRVACSTEYGEMLPPIISSVLTMVTIYQPVWRNPPRSKVLPSQRGALNVFGREYACSSNHSNSSTDGRMLLDQCSDYPVIELIVVDRLSTTETSADVAVTDYDTVCYVDSGDNAHVMLTGSSISREDTVGFRSRGGLVTFDELAITNAQYGQRMEVMVRCFANGIKHELTKMPDISATVELLPVETFIVQEPMFRRNPFMNFSYQIHVNTPIVGTDPFYIVELRNANGTVMTETEGCDCNVTCLEPNVELLGADKRQILRSQSTFSGISVIGEAVGKTVRLEFVCKFDNGLDSGLPVILPKLWADVTVSRCSLGYEPAHVDKTLGHVYNAHTDLQVTPATYCAKCAVTEFSEMGQQCEICPLYSLVNAEPLFIEGHRAGEIGYVLKMRHKRMQQLGRGDEVEIWKAQGFTAMQVGTFCRCETGYFATEDPEEGGSPETWEPAGIKCTPCPEGAYCEENGITFESISAQIGYWQKIEWFQEPKDQAKLSFMSCGDGLPSESACARVGRPSLTNITSNSSNTTCREHHTGVFVSSI